MYPQADTNSALSRFDWVAFDPCIPTSWVMAGKAFEKTYGFVPSNEQIGCCAFVSVFYAKANQMQQ